MPSAKILDQKKEFVSKLSDKLQKSVSGVIVDYRGINVEQDTKLRKNFREAGVDYFVAKNTMLRFAVKDANLEFLNPFFKDTVAVALSYDDPIGPAKVISKYLDSFKDSLKIKAGFIDGRLLNTEDVIALGNLPSKEELVAKVLFGLNSPISGFANVLAANIRGLVTVLDAISKKAS